MLTLKESALVMAKINAHHGNAPLDQLLSFVKSRWTCSAVDLDTVGVQVGRYGRLVGFLCLLVIS